MKALPVVRIDIELVSDCLDVRLRMSDAEIDEAKLACPDLARVLNDSMSALRRRYEREKLPVTGEPSRIMLRAMAEVLRHEIMKRAAALDADVRAIYHGLTLERRDAETGALR